MKDVKSLPDEKLVEYIRSSDKEAFSEIIKRYEKKLLRYAKYLTKNEEGALDIAQNSFIRAFINLNGFNTKKKFSSWIYRIVRNEAINHIKKSSREIRLKVDPLDNDDDLEKEEIRDLIGKSLEELPVSYMEVLVLFFIEERSYEEISDILRMPIGTVGTRINRGKKLLKVILENKGGNLYA